MMDSIVDQAWASLLASVMKKRDILRPEIGDEIDLYVPQSRLLSLLASNPTIPGQLCSYAQLSARRNANNIVRKLGMPADYFWKFEYWPKARAMTGLGQIVKRVFSSMMTQAKEGNLEIVEIDVDPLRITINFGDCAECAGIVGFEYGICYYHAGCFSGILSGLLNRDLNGFETDCCTRGDESCRFIIGDKEDEYIKTEYDTYISPPGISTDLVSRLEKSINKLPVRSLGNLVDINYHQLVAAGTLFNDPQHFASINFEIGSQLGRKMAPILSKCYGGEGLQTISDCLHGTGYSCVEIEESKPDVKLVFRECADAIGDIKTMEMMSFLFGELQGLLSELTKTEMILKESRFENDNILLTFTPKA
ncbi:V4R domain-containing protein [Chloroflexota bacterium]